MSLLSRIYLAIFFLFYFGIAQGDSLQLLMRVLFKHPLPHATWPVAILLTALLLYLARKLEGRNLFGQCHVTPSTPYVMAAWMATALVSIPFGNWLHQMLLAIVAIAGGAADAWLRKRYVHSTRIHPTDIWHKMTPHLAFLLLLSIYMGAGAAATDVQHYEMQTAFRLQQGRPHKALHVGDKSLATSPRLFALRCLALSTRPHQLPKHLLEQALPRGCNSEMLLLPDDAYQQLLISPDSIANRMAHIRHTPGETALHYFRRCAYYIGACPSTASDYYLCALLLDRQLDLFANEIRHFYGPALTGATHESKLPHYFAEALVLYTRTRTQPQVTYHNSTIEANLRDYTAMGDSIPNPTARQNLLRDSYGDTYWWYFNYAHKL